jgi:hypothetical protein
LRSIASRTLKKIRKYFPKYHMPVAENQDIAFMQCFKSLICIIANRALQKQEINSVAVLRSEDRRSGMST